MDNVLEGRATAEWTFLAHKLTKTHPMLGDVLRYWDALRQDNALPARADLDPRVIQGALGHSFILDRARPGTVRLRVAGAHMNDLMGMEVRGMPIRAFFDLMERRRLMELVESVFTKPAILELKLETDGDAAPAMSGRMLILPMRDHAGDVSKALGCLITHGAIGMPPRRFKIDQHQLTPVSQNASAPSAPPTPAKAKMTGFADDVVRFDANLAPVDANFTPGPVPWLRIVQD